MRAWGSLADSPDRYSGYGIPDFSRAVGQSLGIGKTEQGTVLIYPNPTRQGATIVLPSKGRVEVYDLMGRRVFNDETDDVTRKVSLPILPVGIYLVRMSTASGFYCRKLVVEN